MPIYQEALDSQAAKTHLPTELRTRMLQELPPVIRARARFSAAMVHTEYLSTIDKVLERTISGDLDTATGLLELDRSLGSLGFDPVVGAGRLKEHRSYARRKLILDTNLAQAGNYGQWVQNNTDTALALFPCWEYYRAFQKQEPRDWRARWLAAGGKLYEGMMIATKDDPIWTNSVLNRFGTPYPPFDFNSGMRLRPVRRDRAEALGVISAEEDVLPANQEFLAESSVAASAAGDFREEISKALQGIARFDTDGILKMNKGPSWLDLGYESAKTWIDSPVNAPVLVSADAVRKHIAQGIPVTDYDLRPIIIDGRLLKHWEATEKSAKQINGRLERMNFALDTIEAPREHWIDRDHHIYLQVFKTHQDRFRGVVVIVQPDGAVRTYFIEKNMGRLDGTRRGELKFKSGGGQ